MDSFAKLPKDCISKIISFTSPVDASVFAIISKQFKTSSESDTVWNKFLPSDIQHLISRSSSIPVFPTKRDLYLSLSDSPILLDGGKLSFSLNKKTGKKCFTIAAVELIFNGLLNTSSIASFPEEVSRFGEVAVLYTDGLSEICGKISSQMLSKETRYSSYLVYEVVTLNQSYIPPARSVCRFVENESREMAKGRANIVSLDVRGNSYIGRVPRRRRDGWLEVKIGTFFNDDRIRGDIEPIVFAMYQLPIYLEIMTVLGIEFRPEVNV